jgi:ABC-type polysaccharide/polyol phosphate export permease
VSQYLDCIAAIFMRDLRTGFSHPAGLFMRFVNILVAIYGLYCLAGLFDPHGQLGSEHGRPFSYFSYTAVNFTFMLLQGTALQVFSSAIRSDQVSGALEPILQTQNMALPYVLASGLWPMTLALIQVVITLTSAAYFLGLDVAHINIATLLLFMTLSTMVMAAIGILSAAVVIAFKQIPPSNYLISGAAPVLAGVMFPVSRLPHQLQLISWMLPLTHSLHGIRGAFQGASISALRYDALWLTCAIFALLPLSLIALELATARGKNDGTLSHT